MPWVRTLALNELPVGGLQAVTAGEEDVILCRIADQEVYALENCCSHDDAPLEAAELDGREIVCPRHGARFDVTSGAALKMPAPTGIQAFPVRLTADGWIEVDVEDE
jgi:3-phenylpropionate/trans-cinnamate dioxygenase ferredoxin subunit